MTRLLAYLKQLPTIVYLVIAGLGILVGGYRCWAHVQQEYGKRDLHIAQAERTNADLRHAKDSLNVVYRTDTVRFTRYLRTTDSVFANVERWKTDTLKVVEYVAKADTTIRACTQALSTCEQRVGVAQKGWDGARAEIAILKKSIPSSSQKWLYMAIGGGAGYLAGRIK